MKLCVSLKSSPVSGGGGTGRVDFFKKSFACTGVTHLYRRPLLYWAFIDPAGKAKPSRLHASSMTSMITPSSCQTCAALLYTNTESPFLYNFMALRCFSADSMLSARRSSGSGAGGASEWAGARSETILHATTWTCSSSSSTGFLSRKSSIAALYAGTVKQSASKFATFCKRSTMNSGVQSAFVVICTRHDTCANLQIAESIAGAFAMACPRSRRE
mmetsp:Transcript_67884/g.196476  ORF Transcript_67884/g.196476 Transcript_67884/m.196476 type:complete len:216 (+) Transcript_67884:582-1229(+)